jgi:hypothetical protein
MVPQLLVEDMFAPAENPQNRRAETTAATGSSGAKFRAGVESQYGQCR